MREYLDDSDSQNAKEEGLDIVALIVKYLYNWYWFVISISLCLGYAWYTLQKETPIYQVTSSIVLNDDSSTNEALESMGVVSSISTIDNELHVLRSSSIIRQTIEDLDLYVSYYRAGRFRDTEVYRDTPIKMWMTPEEANRIGSPMMFNITKLDGETIEVSNIVGDSVKTHTINKFPSIITTPNGVVSIAIMDEFKFAGWSSDDELIVRIASPASTVGKFKGSLRINRLSQNTSIANPSILVANQNVGIDFLNKLIDIYNQKANDAKNEAASKTANFINERLSIISSELDISELELASYKRNAEIINIESEASTTLAEREEYKARLAANNAQLREVESIMNFISDETKYYEPIVITSTMGNSRISSMVETYNNTLIELNTLLLSSSKSNPSYIILDQSVSAVRQSIIENITALYSTLKNEEQELSKEVKVARSKVANIPTQERELISLERQQEIKAGLYLTMLQKREDNALLLAATANNARVFDDTYASGPVSPDKDMRYMIAILFGLIIPVLIIFIRDMLRFKIESVRDVKKITSIPLVGVIPYLKKMPNANNSIVVEANNNNMMAENFRNLRTNLSYALGRDKKVILVTSTHQAEGKSYVSANLAISLSLLGKKVVLVGLDIRKPGLNRICGIIDKERGITSYLSGHTDDLMSLVRSSEFSPNLNIIFGGTVPPNPTELLNSDRLSDAIEELKMKYDYVILDSAPVGMVTDTLQFSKYADMSLYVCRANVTKKRDFELINEMSRSKRLRHIYTVIIGVDGSKKQYGYGSGYGYGYGYGYGSSYGQGYGKESENKG